MARDILADSKDRLSGYTASIFNKVMDEAALSTTIFIDAHMHSFTY
jgi:hypothetical protein